VLPAVAILGAYLLGSIPFSFVVARAFGVEDVRRVGSGNVGATNVLRSAGRAAGALALLLDAAKGAAATGLALWMAPEPAMVPPLAAVASVLGHMYPVWLGFRGGKGVATGLGAFAPLAPQAALAATLLFVATVVVSRYVSLGSMVGAVSLAVLSGLFGGSIPVVGVASAVAVLVIVRHRSNLRRLWEGSERRTGSAPAREARQR
jgi:glycerol-3-phosphate acyltransferase PlsY